jgi:hypothetical protein
MHSLGADIPVKNHPCRIQHKNCVFLDSVKERSKFLFAVAERHLCYILFDCVLIKTPTCERCDQQTYTGCDDKQILRQPKAPFRVGIPQFQQSKLFVPEVADDPLKLIVDRIVCPTLAGFRCVQTVALPSLDDRFSAS